MPLKWLRPLVAGALLPAAAAAALMGPASLLGFAASPPTITLNPNYGPPGTTTKVVGHGFCVAPCTPVTFKVGLIAVAGTASVAANGSFSICIEIPGTVRPPTANVIASQRDQNGALVSASATFAVTPSAPPPAQCAPAPTTPPVGVTPSPKVTPSAKPPASPTPGSTPTATPASSPSPAASASPATAVTATPSATTMWIAIAIAIGVAAGFGGFLWWRRRSSGGGV